MEKGNFLVSVFLNGKNAKLFFSEDLHELANIRTSRRDYVIEVFDVSASRWFTSEEIQGEIIETIKCMNNIIRERRYARCSKNTD